MRTMRRKRYRRYRVVILLSIISIVVFIVFIEAEKALKPVAKLRAEQFAKQTADNVIAAVVSEYLTDNRFTYEDFAVVMYNDDN